MSSPEAPGPEAAAPGLEAAAPGLEATAPGLEATAPGLEAAAPGLEAAAPGLEAAAPGLEAAAPGHYFSVTPGSPEQRRTITASVWGRDLVLTTANGVFAGSELDRGTAVLLRSSVPPQGSPTLLDLGCGYGPIALGLAVHCPGAQVDAVDVNERALALCRDNSAALDVAERVRVLRPEEVEPDRRYDAIWSNPPIRIGKPALHALLLQWLPRLTPEGEARLVVGKNLGADTLQRWLVEQGYHCERAASAKGFRVLVVRPGTSTGDRPAPRPT